MSKGKSNQSKEGKKKATLTLLEKRAAKKSKKASSTRLKNDRTR
ncbi:MAG: hypothetical protein ABW185_01070 [Sedimenticola sp.]